MASIIKAVCMGRIFVGAGKPVKTSARDSFTVDESLLGSKIAREESKPHTMETIVIGHRNPDMDSVCSAVAYAELKKRLGHDDVRPARAGALNERIAFVLEKFGVPQPEFIPDVTPRVRDAMIRDYVSIRPDQPIAEALALMSSKRLRALPVVDEDRRFHGTISENTLLGLVMPSRESAQRAREVLASLANIAGTFEGRSLTGPLPEDEQNYALVVAAMDANTFAGRLKNLEPSRTVLFVGDRENVHRAALDGGVRALVVTGGAEVSPAFAAAAKAKGMAVIVSPWDTATSVIFARGAMITRHALEEVPVKFDADMPLEIARRTVALSNKFIFPVLEADGRLDGILSKSDFLRGPARQLILVDHNELSQAVPGATDLPIVEILDHHRLGNMPTEAPILFLNQPVGSTCTIVADLFRRHNLEPPRPVAGVMLAGIIADTLCGTSPTTTETDRQLLEKLGRLAGIRAQDLAAEIFSVGSPLQTMSPDRVIGADAKEYEEHGVRFSISQIEEVTFANFERQRDLLQEALRAQTGAAQLFFSALLVTDINAQNSYLMVEGNHDLLRTINYPEHSDRVWFLEGVVSRKKQLLPYLLECLAKVR
jgi:manganese-dependent inorganic pyrophosphatase